MKVLVSACLLGENCKYNGGNNHNQKLIDWINQNNFEVIPVCPEVLGGLPTPRVPSEIVDGIVTNKAGIIVDKQFRLGAKIALEKAIEEKVEIAVLQSRSPSCGIKQIYDGSFSGKKIKGQGIFAKMILDTGIKAIDVEDL